MQAILMGVAICLFGVAVTVLLVAVAFRQEEDTESPAESKQGKRTSFTAEQFFLANPADLHLEPGAPMDPLLLKLQRHVQLEHEAAETFLRGPSVDSLHAPSSSPLWD